MERSKIKEPFGEVETSKEYKGYTYSIGGRADAGDLGEHLWIAKCKPNPSMGGNDAFL